MTSFIRTIGLTKHFRSAVALGGVDLQIAKGECLGLIGPTGGGRSTLVRVLATLLRPTSGIVEIDGVDAVKHVFSVRSRLAYAGEESLEGLGLRAGEYLEFVHRARRADRSLRGVTSAAAVLERAGVPADTSVDSLPSSLRQRLTVATALSIRADILLLDCPLGANDPAARTQLLDWLRQSRDAGTTMVVVVGDDADLESLCHRVAVLDGGRIETRTSRHDLSEGLQVMAAASRRSV